MRRLLLIPIAFVTLLIPVAVLAGSGEGFDGVVRSIESKYNIHATRIPFLGLVSLISQKASHGGVSGLRVAEFEHLSGPVDGDELNRLVEEKLGADWERIIRETSRQGVEQTLIFIHPEGERMGVFVVDYDSKEMNVVEISVDPDQLKEKIGHYQHHHDHGDGDESD
jgi:hypothetical protein